MVEIELKFQVPAAQRAGVERAVRAGAVERHNLRALYFDTPSGTLAGQALSLRLRREGRQWVQTVKGSAQGKGVIQRWEHDAPRGGQAAVPALDLRLHAGTPAGDALIAALGGDIDAAAAQLSVRHETQVVRLTRTLRAAGGTQVELAFDVGQIKAGEHKVELCELEFELKRGRITAFTGLAERWVQRHGLWLDTRSKAERGHLLASGLAVSPAARARNLRLPKGIDARSALRAIVGNAVEQALPNASAVAADVAEPDHVHQLRVALRRLRSALRDLVAADAPIPAHWSDALKQVFGHLGQARDRDVMAATLLPALERAGGPPLVLPRVLEESDAGEVMRSVEVGMLWLELLAFAHDEDDAAARAPAPSPAPTTAPPAPMALTALLGSPSPALTSPPPLPAPAPPPPAPPTLATTAAARLSKLHKRLQKDSRVFGKLSEEERHDARKRLKRLRYASEFVASLFPAKAVERYLEKLRPAQEVLGEFNDLCTARNLLGEQVASDPRAYFALGWLAASEPALLARCQAELQGLAKAPPFWK